jgi:ribosome biogenesis GTPase
MMEFDALVLASYGRGALVAAGDEILHCALSGRKLRVVCGDRVACRRQAAGETPRIESVLPRRNLIERIDQRGNAEAVAANVDRLAITVAPEPEPDWFVADRYWAGARLCEIPAVFIINKSDLNLDSMRAEIDSLRNLNAACIEVSAYAPQGLVQLRQALSMGTTLIVGQSGVGKSTLVNALVGDAAAQTAELTRDAEGRHTTTTARRYALDSQAAIVDAPGVRDFAPPARALRAAQYGFQEIEQTSAGCRFSDCRHFDEPGCAVRAAVTSGQISARRYESYRRLARLYQGFVSRQFV